MKHKFENEKLAILSEERFKQDKNENVPGPGSYNYVEKQKVYNKGNNFITNQDRFGSFKKISLPGPGQYNPMNNILDNVKEKSTSVFKSENPKLLEYNNDNPGPGAYEVKIDNSKNK